MSAVLHHFNRLPPYWPLCTNKSPMKSGDWVFPFEPTEPTHLPERQMGASTYTSAQMEPRHRQNVFVCSCFLVQLAASFNYKWLEIRLQCFKDMKARHTSMDQYRVLDTANVPTCGSLHVRLFKCVCLKAGTSETHTFLLLKTMRRPSWNKEDEVALKKMVKI